MSNKLFSKLKAKYPLAALVVLIVAALLGKPILDESGSDQTTTETTVVETVTTDSAVTEPTVTETIPTAENNTDEVSSSEEQTISDYTFRSEEQYLSHYEKHGIEMGFASAEEYLAAANKVISSPDALYKLEAEDNDHVYYLEATNEFVVLSQDGYIRTYFLPSAGIDYFNRQ